MRGHHNAHSYGAGTIGGRLRQGSTDNERPRPVGGAGRSLLYDPDAQPDLYEGVLSKRVVAFVADAIIIVFLMIPAGLVVFVIGIVTLGIGWLLYGALFAIVALGYVAFTLGGPNSATVGMRWAGIELRTWNGGPCFPRWPSFMRCSSGSRSACSRR